MRHLTWFLVTFLVVGFVGAADAQFPRPRAPQAPVTQTTEPATPTAVTPVVNVAPPTVNVAPPTVNVTPQLSLPQSTMTEDIKSWLNTIFAGGIMALLAKIGFAPTAPKESIPGTPNVDILLKLREKIADPNLRAGIDTILLHAIQSGIPGMAIQTGLSLIPGAGPAASTLEPLVRSVVVDVLSKSPIGGAPGDTSTAQTVAQAVPAVPALDIVSMIGGLKDLIDQRIPAKV